MAYGTDDFTNVTGAITVTISGKANYTGTVTRTYQITPAPYSISTDSASKVYDGRVLTADGRIDGLVNGETVDFKVTGAQRKVGSSKNIYSLEWTGTAKESNYALASATVGDLVVSESTEKVVVNVSGGTFTYDGQAHGATVTVSPLPEGHIVAEAASTASATDVTSGVTATADKLVIRNAEGEDVTNQLDVTVNPGTIVVTPPPLRSPPRAPPRPTTAPRSRPRAPSPASSPARRQPSGPPAPRPRRAAAPTPTPSTGTAPPSSPTTRCPRTSAP